MEDMHTWEERYGTAKELLKEMLQSRSEAAELSKMYDSRWVSRKVNINGPPHRVRLLAVTGNHWAQT